jgi:hypothetical protein
VFRVQFQLNYRHDPGFRRIDEGNLGILIDALYNIDRLWLRTHPKTPRLYQSGVVYRAEPIGREDWRDISAVLHYGNGDCEDLACWRAAELRELDGIDARPTYRWRQRDGIRVYHILVKLPDGTTEDPSRKLGMGKIRSNVVFEG